MKSSNRQFHALALISIASAALAACGGGGDAGSAGSAGSAGTSTILAANTSPLAAMQGTYVMPCDGDKYNGPAGESSQATITVTAAPGSNQVDAAVHYSYYDGSTDCASATLNFDITGTGHITSKATTKAYTDAAGKSVSANVMTLTYGGMTLSKGIFTGTFPLPGATTDIAYVLDGNTLSWAKGVRGADGLGDSLSARTAVRQ